MYTESSNKILCLKLMLKKSYYRKPTFLYFASTKQESITLL